MKNLLLSALVAVVSILPLQADTFGSGGNQFTLDFTSIGSPGNAADPLTGKGYVPYTYSMGTYAISQNQIIAATANGLLGMSPPAWSQSLDQPAGCLSWYQAAAFVNWLDTSTGHQAAYNLTYSNGSYTMDLWHSWDAGYDPNNLYRNKNAVYVLPSENEFYKAAYGKSDGSGYTLYATGSDSVPTGVPNGTNAGTIVVNNDWGNGPASVFQAGGLSSYGTMGQTGNTFQWTETAYDGVNDSVGKSRSTGSIGYWYNISDPNSYWYAGGLGAGLVASSYSWDTGPNNVSYPYMGFRVAAVPEPSTYALLGLGLGGLFLAVRRKRIC